MRLALALSIICAFAVQSALPQQADPRLAIYREWNACVETLKEEGNYDDGLWPRLRDSLTHEPPEKVKSLDRIAILDELIAIHERRLVALKKMRELERK